MFNTVTKSLLFVSAISMLAPTVSAASSEVNVYSGRKEALIKPLLTKFEKETGIEVNLITGKADALLQRIRIEGNASPADVFVTVDAGRLQRAKDANILQPISSDVLIKNIPANLRDADNLWFGLSQRARVIFYNKAKVNSSELSTYEDLTQAKWKGKICLRSSNSIYNQSLVASMIENVGLEKTEAWAKGLIKNLARPPAGGDIDQLKAVAAGVCDITIVNTYYFGRLTNSEKSSDHEVVKAVGLFWPNQNDRGAHMNVSGAGVVKSAANKANAIKLIEYMSIAESQSWYASVNSEFPVKKGVEVSATLKNWGEFKSDAIALNKLGENNRAAVELMDRVGWK